MHLRLRTTCLEAESKSDEMPADETIQEKPEMSEKKRKLLSVEEQLARVWLSDILET